HTKHSTKVEKTTMAETNSVWTRAYTPAGLQVSITFTFDADALPPAAEIESRLANAGYLVAAPGLEPDVNKMEIDSVIRRRTVSDKERHVIDFYPPFIGEWGENRYGFKYIDTPEDIAEFEAF